MAQARVESSSDTRLKADIFLRSRMIYTKRTPDMNVILYELWSQERSPLRTEWLAIDRGQSKHV